jgi:DNA-binding beta-propeller fold protein YncE/transcriptional regulator with XRE-family HTH domain
MSSGKKVTFGELLSRYRLAAGLTQQDLADRAELSVRGISDLERGVKTRPRAYTVHHLAEALNLTTADRNLFEQSALEPAKRRQEAQPARSGVAIEHTLRAPTGLRSFRTRLRNAPRRSHQRVLIALGAAMTVTTIIGALAFALRPGSAQETKAIARLRSTWTIAASPSTLVAPAAIAIGEGNIVYVADSGADRIDAFTANGRLLFAWGTLGHGPGQLQDPQGLAPDAFGHVYVADTGNNRIDKFSSRGRFIRSFGRRGTHSGQFRSPEGVAVGTFTGWVYVADTGNSRIQAFTPSGVPIGGWDAHRTQRGEIVRPTSLVVTADGEVIAADGQAHQVQVLDNDGSFLRHAVSLTPPEFLDPSAVAEDSNGHQYTLDTGRQTVREFDAIGTVLATWHGHFSSAAGLAVDSHGTVYVADTGRQRILRFARGGTLTASWNGASAGEIQTASARALARDSRGKLYVADSLGNQIVVLSPAGRVLTRLRGGGNAGPLHGPSGVAVDTRGWVYVADTGANRIVKMSMAGTVKATWDQRRIYPGPFDRPHSVRVDTLGHIFVADTLNNRIEELTSTGASMHVWYPDSSSACTGPAVCGAWNGMATDSRGFVYATDTLHNVVVELSPRGQTVHRWGSTGSAPGQFRSPEGVAVSHAGTMYVADTGNHRVQVLDPSGHVIGIIRDGLDDPADLLLDDSHGAADTLYVADSGDGLVRVFSITH